MERREAEKEKELIEYYKKLEEDEKEAKERREREKL